MLQYIKIAVLVLIPCFASAQSVSVVPQSFGFIGVRGYTEVSIQTGDIGFHFYWNRFNEGWIVKGNHVGEVTKKTFGVSYTPIKIGEYIRLGGIVYPRPFPTSQASRLNFYVEAGIPIGDFRISYNHISNGFGLINMDNPGYDAIKLTYHFK